MSLKSLLDAIDSQGDAESIAVTLEEFFEGNTDLGSIGCNLGPVHPGIQAFYETLRKLREQPEVSSVLVGIFEIEDGEWPYSEQVFVTTTASREQLERWTEGLHVDEIEDGWMGEKPEVAPRPPKGHKVYTLWWD